LGNKLVDAGAGQAVLDAYTTLLTERGDVNASGGTNAGDVAALYASFGTPSWLMDMNVDGAVDIDDVSTMITEIFRTVPGDFNVDGFVNAADYVRLRKGEGTTGALYTEGDADLDGDVDENDRSIWQSRFGFERQDLMAAGGGSGAALVPEPAALALVMFGLGLLTMSRRSFRRGV
jgi:hypothetical protein